MIRAAAGVFAFGVVGNATTAPPVEEVQAEVAVEASGEYCPTASDLGFDYNSGGGSIHDQGWTVTGGARVHTRAAFNMLGGYVEFDLDASAAHTGVNNNFYTISPDNHGGAYEGSSQYCDGQAPGGKYCMELDIIEANGNCGGATTLHTHQGWGGGCDQGGCQASYHFNGQPKMRVRTEWSLSGEMTTTVGSQPAGSGQMHPSPGSGDFSTIQQTMERVGVVFQSSQWTGWVPVSDCGSSGDLGSSRFAVSNLRIKGSVVQGPEPAKCSGPSPSPSPTPSPSPSPTPSPTPSPSPPGSCPGSDPSRCDCSWTQGGAVCGSDDGSECYCRCCCEHTASHKCRWNGLLANTTAAPAFAVII